MKSIAVKLLKTVFSLYLIVTVLSTCVHIYSDYSQRKKELLQELENIQVTFAPTLANSLWDFNKQQTVISAKGIESLENITGVVVKDEEGRAVYESAHLQSLALEDIQGLSQSYKLYQIGEDELKSFVGEIVLVSDRKFVVERVKWSVIIILANACIKTILLWMLFLFAFKKFLKEPLNDLSDQAKEIDFSPGAVSKIDLKHSEYTELNILQTSINDLLQRLSVAMDDLHGLNNSLEDKVKERTQELEDKNKVLLAAKNETDRANRVKGDFIANISHELRTPLNAIRGFTDSLQREYGTPDNEFQFEAIFSSSDSLLRIIDDILDITKVEQGKMSLHWEPVNLLSIMEKSFSSFKALADKKSLSFNLILPDNFEPCVRCDKTRLSQVLNNLLENALKFTSEGSVDLRLEQKLHGNLADLKITVSDTGVGIPKNLEGKIFEPFEQNEEHSGKVGGTGLGLAISRKIAQLLGGSLSVDSEEGKGSCFTLELLNLKVDLAECEKANSISLHDSNASLDNELSGEFSDEELEEISGEFIRYQPLMENFLESMTINDVQEIASSLKELCKKIPLPELIDWRKEFKLAYDNFDMMELSRLFEGSRQFIKQIEAMKRNK